MPTRYNNFLLLAFLCISAVFACQQEEKKSGSQNDNGTSNATPIATTPTPVPTNTTPALPEQVPTVPNTTNTACAPSTNGVVNPLCDRTNEVILPQWNEVLNPEALKACQATGKIYDRATQKCLNADKATSYACTLEGIINKFKSNNLSVEADLTSMTTNGFEIDQCGEVAGSPIVLFYKKVDSQDSLKLQIMTLCKKGSAACP